MKKQKFFGAITAATLFCLSFTACGSDSDEDDLTQQTPQSPIVATADPAGTVVVNLRKGSSANEQSVGVGKIYVDDAGNFTSDRGHNYGWGYYGWGYENDNIEFASVGIVNGLSGVLSIPSKGWSNSIAVTVGTGYVVNRNNVYARMYVVSASSTGITVKYQYPIAVPIKLKQAKFTIDSSYHTIQAELTNPTSVNIVSYPDWCGYSDGYFISNGLSYYHNNGKAYISIYVQENTTGQSRTGEIVLKNDVSSAKITIVQEG